MALFPREVKEIPHDRASSLLFSAICGEENPDINFPSFIMCATNNYVRTASDRDQATKLVVRNEIRYNEILSEILQLLFKIAHNPGPRNNLVIQMLASVRDKPRADYEKKYLLVKRNIQYLSGRTSWCLHVC